MLASSLVKIVLALTIGSLALKLSSARIRISTAETRSVNAVQTMYRGGVPHTDRNGNIRYRYDGSSFLPRCIYHAIPGSFQAIRSAGFNCAHTYEQYGVADVIGEMRSADLQLLKHWPTDEEIGRFKSDPNILGWYLDEEPTHRTYLEMEKSGRRTLMSERYEAYLSRRAAIKAVDPHHPVFPLESGWIPRGMQSWWERWNTAGDVAVYDHYPLELHTADIELFAKQVSLAAKINRQTKPIWLTVQAYRSNGAILPTPDQLRGMVFTGLIHGATGIIYFAYDSWVTRAWDVVGIAPETPVSHGVHHAATPGEVRRSRALWAGTRALNAELDRLTPQLLSPTATVSYTVSSAGPSRTRSPIRAMLKQREGVYTLFASNIEKASLGARFEFPESLASIRRLNPDGSTTLIATRVSSFGDSFGGFSARVYEIRME